MLLKIRLKFAIIRGMGYSICCVFSSGNLKDIKRSAPIF